MEYISLLLLIAFPALFISCNGGKKEKIVRLVEEWQGKTILFPGQMVFTSYQDTVGYHIPEAEYKILVYIDAIGCTNRKLQLPKWKALIRQTDSITGGKVPFLLDRENRVVVIGNPIHNGAVCDLYLKEITENRKEPALPDSAHGPQSARTPGSGKILTTEPIRIQINGKAR